MNSLSSMLTQPWFFWGLVVLFGFPASVILVNEIIYHLKQQYSGLLSVMRETRHWLLPSLFVYLLLHKVFLLPMTDILLRCVLSTFWIIFIHVGLKFLDVLIFSETSSYKLQRQVPKLLIDFLRAFLVLLGVAFVLSWVWEANLGQLLTALGVGSLVLGLALQDVVGGLFSGIALLSSRPFSVGNWIKVQGVEGQIKSMDWRAVYLEDRQGDKVVIPNATIAKESFHNFSHPKPLHIETIELRFGYQDPPNQVKKSLLAAMADVPGILSSPAAYAELLEYGDFGMSYTANYYIEDYLHQPDIRDAFMGRVWYVSHRHGLHLVSRLHHIHKSPQYLVEYIIALLNSLHILTLNETETRLLAEQAHLETYGADEYILKKDQHPDFFYIIVSGKLHEYIDSTHGHTLPLNKLIRNDFIGITEMIRRNPSAVDIQAKTDSQLLAIDLDTMHNLLQSNLKVAQELENMAEMKEKQIKKAIRDYTFDFSSV